MTGAGGQGIAQRIGDTIGLTAAGAGGEAQTASTTDVSHNTAIWAVIGAGLVMVVLADFSPRVVNGVLVLILAGVILKHLATWIPWLNGVSQSFSNKG